MPTRSCQNDFPTPYPPETSRDRDERAVRLGNRPEASLPMRIMAEVATRYRLKNGSFDQKDGVAN